MATDGRYIKHTAVALASIINFCSTSSLRIQLLVYDIDRQHTDRLNDWLCSKQVSVNFIEVNPADLAGAYVHGHVSLATYFRLMLPELLSPSLDRCLYLDSDLVVCGPLDELFEIDLAGRPIAAVEDPYVSQDNFPIFDSSKPYFNAGVMIYGLHQTREIRLVEKCLDFLKKNQKPLRYWDQDVLNFYLKDNWLPLHPRWNRQARWDQAERWNQQFVRYRRGDGGRICTHEEISEAIKAPRIIHFSTASKPWIARCTHPLSKLYWDFIQDTPWADTVRPRKTLREQSGAVLDWIWSLNFR